MAPLQPFDKHQADTASLTSCGSTLITKAADGITNGKLTKTAYAPAITTVRGMCAPEVQTADRAVQQGSQDVTGSLAWAAVVSQYWGTQVTDFNTEVARITGDLEALGPSYGAEGEGGEEPTQDAIDAAKTEETAAAKRLWWAAHAKYIEAGQTNASAMLRDGPTKAHLQTAIDAGTMPGLTWEYGDSPDDYWNNFMGIWKMPDGTAIDKSIWAGKLTGLIGSWTGHDFNRFANWRYAPLPAPYSGFANTGWRGYFNRSNWVQRYNMPRYGWARPPLPFTTRAPLPYNMSTGRFSRFDNRRLPFRRQMVPVTGWSRLAGVADKGFYALSFAGGAYDQWTRDSQRTDLSTGEKVTRSATRGAVKLAGTYAGIETGAWAGGTIGMAIGGPAGAVVGGMVGGLVGGVIGSGVADEVADYAVEAVTDPVETLEDIGDGLEDVGEDIGDTLKFW